MNFIVSAATDIGTVKSTNQDSYSVKVFNTPQGKMVFAVLCDGMGGLEKGEMASASLVNAFNKWAQERLSLLSQSPITDSDIRNEWTSIAITFNEKIKTYGKMCGVSMGTTLTALLLTGDRYYIINVGDTRAYELAEGTKLLTEGQTVVAREVKMGNITPEEARNDSRRSVLLQCVGASDEVYPDFFFGDVKKDAVYMLCSDGFRHEITEEEIYSHLNPAVMLEAEGMKSNMLTLVDLNKQRKERDNITVLAIRTF